MAKPFLYTQSSSQEEPEQIFTSDSGSEVSNTYH